MSRYSHCQECGRKVTSAYFCRNCEGAFCTLRCLDQHAAKHQAGLIRTQRPASPGVVNEPAQVGAAG